MSVKLRELSTKCVFGTTFSSLSEWWFRFPCEIVQITWHTARHWVYYWAEDTGITFSTASASCALSNWSRQLSWWPHFLVHAVFVTLLRKPSVKRMEFKLIHSLGLLITVSLPPMVCLYKPFGQLLLVFVGQNFREMGGPTAALTIVNKSPHYKWMESGTERTTK